MQVQLVEGAEVYKVKSLVRVSQGGFGESFTFVFATPDHATLFCTEHGLNIDCDQIKAVEKSWSPKENGSTGNGGALTDGISTDS